jgi:hypothetical protein
MRHAPVAALVALLGLAACTPVTVVPDAERERTRAALDGASRWLRVAVTVQPLFGDRSKLLLLDAPAGEVDLLRTAADAIVPPPPAERVLPPGTPVRIVEVEFPTGLLIARRVVMTPRYHPWVLLRVAGDPRPHVLVLSQTVATAEAAFAEVERVLASDDPSGQFQALTAEQRAAVLKKEPIEGMGPQAVTMAWGLPELRRIDRPAGSEEWTWPGGKRRASFRDDKLVKWERLK